MPAFLLRIFAVALLLVAIPAQGMASVMAGQCMAFGHHQDAGSHDHEHAQDGADGHEHDAQTPSDEGKSSHCGPCVACCASTSIAGPVGLPIPSSPSNANYLFSQFPPLGVQPHGLDRPPLAL